MKHDEMYDSAVRASGDLGAFFEFDGETGYFYLAEVYGPESIRIVGYVHVFTGFPDFTESDVRVVWDDEELRVGLLIRNRLWALFDEDRVPHGGGYGVVAEPRLPAGSREAFEPRS